MKSGIVYAKTKPDVIDLKAKWCQVWKEFQLFLNLVESHQQEYEWLEDNRMGMEKEKDSPDWIVEKHSFIVVKIYFVFSVMDP